MTICPRCEQGDVRLRTVVPTGELVQICEECEALWPAGSQPTYPPFSTLQDFVNARGLADHQIALEDPPDLDV